MAGTEAVDYDQLEEYFRALAFSSRLELLHQLRFPRALGDIRLRARRDRPGETPARVISRQALQEHLDKLLEVGLLTAQDADGRRGRREYAVNSPRLYQIMEEFRQVGTVVAHAPGGRDATVDTTVPRAAARPDGPHLALVHGLLEGKTFVLSRASLRDERGWVIGRESGLHVSLEYDPFVSLENSEILPMPDGSFTVLDLRGSKNGTWLNWQRLGRDERPALRPGDVLGVGRSLLVFRAA